MEEISGNNIADLFESTPEPGILMSPMSEDDVPKLTAAAIVGVTLVVLVAIVAVFLLGVLIDCRQQRLLEKKMGEAKRPKSTRRVSAHPDGDGASIVNNMEEPELSVPPADALRTVTVA